MLVVSSPSGAGKTTLTKRLLDRHRDLVLSVSVTTRPKRPKEVEGSDYFFRTREEFIEMHEAGRFLEHAEVFGNLYGTPRDFVREALERSDDVLFDIDWQGAQQLEEIERGDLVKVFILPPSRAALETRLRQRAQDPDHVIAERMIRADDEISHWPEYDYVIVNEDVDRAENELNAILMAERLKRRRRVGLSRFVASIIERG